MLQCEKMEMAFISNQEYKRRMNLALKYLREVKKEKILDVSWEQSPNFSIGNTSRKASILLGKSDVRTSDSWYEVKSCSSIRSKFGFIKYQLDVPQKYIFVLSNLNLVKEVEKKNFEKLLALSSIHRSKKRGRKNAVSPIDVLFLKAKNIFPEVPFRREEKIAFYVNLAVDYLKSKKEKIESVREYFIVSNKKKYCVKPVKSVQSQIRFFNFPSLKENYIFVMKDLKAVKEYSAKGFRKFLKRKISGGKMIFFIRASNIFPEMKRQKKIIQAFCGVCNSFYCKEMKE